MMRLALTTICALLPLVESAAAQPANTQRIELTQIRQLRENVDGWPMIANASTPAELRVNATLTKLNRRLIQALHDCDESARESAKAQGGESKGQDPAAEDWTRKVEVTMTGPRFLSLVASDESFCGSAHPDNDQMAMVFDMTTGATVSWTSMVARSARASAVTDTISDGSTVGALTLPALEKMNLDATDADCKDAFQSPQSFLLWPDARSETLVAMPIDLPHVVQACANEIHMTIDQARKLGFDENLLGAIHQAHLRGAAQSKK